MKEKSPQEQNACQKERLQKWKEHFKNLLGKPPEVTDKIIKYIIYSQLDIKLGQFMEGEFDPKLKKRVKTENLKASTKYFLKYGRQEN